jgi:alanine racemase
MNEPLHISGGARAEISAAALQHNLALLRQRLVGGARLLAVVKADAYGHGAALVAPVLAAAGADWFGVATWEEALELRAAGVGQPVLLLTGTLGVGKGELDELVEQRVSVALLDREHLRRLLEQRLRGPLSVHIKVDTGMGRLGVFPQQVFALAEEVYRHPQLRLEGVFSHFGSATKVDSPFTREQLARFLALRAEWPARWQPAPLFHLANSAATWSLPESHADLVRPGIALYGVAPDGELAMDGLEPAMRLCAPVLQVREVPAGTPVSYGQTFVTARASRLAVVGIGYADGYDRRLSGRAEVLVRGQRAPVVGRVCMDMTVIDVTDIAGVVAGDEVVLWGKQGEEEIRLAEVSRWSGAIPYELLTRIGRRVRRCLTAMGGRT